MLLQEKLKKYRIVLASQSPRRQMLLKGLDIEFVVQPLEADESYPSNLTREQIPLYLSQWKATHFNFTAELNELVITADTIVWIDNKILGKPENQEEAYQTLKTLSGRTHEVITGVTISTVTKTVSFYVESKVDFRHISDEEISYYVANYQPFDKAGAYGIQEWIGYIGIEKIDGSFYNVMGLPVQRLYCELLSF